MYEILFLYHYKLQFKPAVLYAMPVVLRQISVMATLMNETFDVVIKFSWKWMLYLIITELCKIEYFATQALLYFVYICGLRSKSVNMTAWKYTARWVTMWWGSMVSIAAPGSLPSSHQMETASVLNLILTTQYRSLALLQFSLLVRLWTYIYVKISWILFTEIV